MKNVNIYLINSASKIDTKPIIMIGQEEGWGNIRRIVPNPNHPIPGYAITPQIISQHDPRFNIKLLESHNDFHQALQSATRLVQRMGLAS